MLSTSVLKLFCSGFNKFSHNGSSCNCLYCNHREECTELSPCAMSPCKGILDVLTHSKDNPLHISLFPPFLESRLKFSFLINSCLDIFDIRRKQTSVEQDLGLLQAVDERLAAYGWLTNTGVKFLILVDMAGRHMPADAERGRVTTVSGIKDSDLKPVSLTILSF